MLDIPDLPIGASADRYHGVQVIRLTMLHARQLDLPLTVVHDEAISDYGWLYPSNEEPF